jgi:FkbM family methyltransferase
MTQCQFLLSQKVCPVYIDLSFLLRSRYGEDKEIYDLFKNLTIDEGWNGIDSYLPKGTYIELGAFDGISESNTMFFDKCLGWEGLLIERQSGSYQKVIQNQPHAVKLSFLPTCAGVNKTVKFHNYPMLNSGLEGSAKTYESRSNTVEVPCELLTSVLQDVFSPSKHISFMSLDVEGAESMVLSVLDLNVVAKDVIMIKIMNIHYPLGSCPNTHKVRKHMAKTGKYDVFYNFVKASDVYIRFGTNAWKRAKSSEMARERITKS